MKTHRKTPLQFALIYGLLVAAIPALYNTLLVVFKQLDAYYGDDPGGSMQLRTTLFILPLVIGIAIYQYKKKHSGYLKLKDAIGIGLVIALITQIGIIAYHILFDRVLAPSFHLDFYEKHGQEIYDELVACCAYTQEQFENHKNLRIDYGKTLSSIMGGILSTAIIGLIVSTIVGLFMKKKGPKGEDLASKK